LKTLTLAALVAGTWPLMGLAADAADPAAPVPRIEYRCAFAGTPRGVEEGSVDWKTANAEVGLFPRGHVDLLKWEEAQGVQRGPAKQPAPPPAAPASARPAPSSGQPQQEPPCDS
jgi:hypothetical protein